MPTLPGLHFRETLLVQDQTCAPAKAVSFTQLLYFHFLPCLTSKLQRTRAPLLRGSHRTELRASAFVANLLLAAAQVAKFLQLLYVAPAPAVPRLLPAQCPRGFPAAEMSPVGQMALGVQGRSCMCKWV